MKRQSHPWSHGYAYPEFIEDEYPELDVRAQAAVVSSGTPRKTISQPAIFARKSSWSSGYAVPRAITQERRTGNVRVSPGMTRKTFLYGFGDTDIGQPDDPVIAFGKKSARTLLQSVNKVPADVRGLLLQTEMKALDPRLPGLVNSRVKQLVAKGYSERDALERSLAVSIADTFVKQVSEAGIKKISLGSTDSLGCPDCGGCCKMSNPSDLGISFEGAWSDVKGAVKKTGSAIKKGAQKTWSAGKDAGSWAVDKIGKGACKLLNSDIGRGATTAGAAIAGTAVGVPPNIGVLAAGAGTGALANKCAKGGDKSLPGEPQKESTMETWLPIVAGAGLALVVLSGRKK